MAKVVFIIVLLLNFFQANCDPMLDEGIERLKMSNNMAKGALSSAVRHGFGTQITRYLPFLKYFLSETTNTIDQLAEKSSVKSRNQSNSYKEETESGNQNDIDEEEETNEEQTDDENAEGANESRKDEANVAEKTLEDDENIDDPDQNAEEDPDAEAEGDEEGTEDLEDEEAAEIQNVEGAEVPGTEDNIEGLQQTNAFGLQGVNTVGQSNQFVVSDSLQIENDEIESEDGIEDSQMLNSALADVNQVAMNGNIVDFGTANQVDDFSDQSSFVNNHIRNGRRNSQHRNNRAPTVSDDINGNPDLNNVEQINEEIAAQQSQDEITNSDGIENYNNQNFDDATQNSSEENGEIAGRTDDEIDQSVDSNFSNENANVKTRRSRRSSNKNEDDAIYQGDEENEYADDQNGYQSSKNQRKKNSRSSRKNARNNKSGNFAYSEHDVENGSYNDDERVSYSGDVENFNNSGYSATADYEFSGSKQSSRKTSRKGNKKTRSTVDDLIENQKGSAKIVDILDSLSSDSDEMYTDLPEDILQAMDKVVDIDSAKDMVVIKYVTPGDHILRF